MATPLSSVGSVSDENIGLENGVIRTNGEVLTELDRVSPSFYLKRETMPTAYGLTDQNGNTTTETDAEVTLVTLS